MPTKLVHALSTCPEFLMMVNIRSRTSAIMKKKHFSQKVGALKRMRQLPPKVLEEIYFKSIIPAVIYGIVVWGNCSSAMLNSLNPIHERAARLIHDQDDLESLNWLPLSYFYNRRLLLFMFDVIKHNVPDNLASLFTLKVLQ